MSHAADLLGFVTIDVIQNIFIDEFRKIEEDIDINGMPLDRRIVIEWMDDIRLRLMQRARDNLKDYLQKSPELKKDLRDAKTIAEQDEARKGWKDRVVRNRNLAKLSEGE